MQKDAAWTLVLKLPLHLEARRYLDDHKAQEAEYDISISTGSEPILPKTKSDILKTNNNRDTSESVGGRPEGLAISTRSA